MHTQVTRKLSVLRQPDGASANRATDGETLAELDAKMAFQAVAVDLPRLWELLGSGATN